MTTSTAHSRTGRLAAWWPYAVPLLALVALAVSWGHHLGGVPIAVIAVLLMGAILASVHHAEVVAHWVGEPFGSLILAVAVTVIEVGLIVTLMVSGAPGAASLARDTVFAAVMITCNGIVGLAILAAARRHHVAVFNAEGATAALAAVTVIASLCLVLPVFTLGTPGPQFSPSQLAFAAVCSLIVYGMFVVTQNVRHKDLFLPADEVPRTSGDPADGGTTSASAGSGTPATDRAAVIGTASVEVAVHDTTPADEAVRPAATDDEPPNHLQMDDPPRARVTPRAGTQSLIFLLLALLAVVGLAKLESPAIESGVDALGLPQSVVGVLIALLILLPETATAVRAASANRVQISLNLALGSAMASIGLTIPTIAIAMIWLPGPLILGLSSTQIVLLVLTVVMSTLTLASGRALRLHGAIHLVIAAAFVFLAINP